MSMIQIPADVPTPSRQIVAEEVRALLGRRRLTGNALAGRIGRSQSYVSRRLTGEIPFDTDDLDLIAGVLGVAVSNLLPPQGTTGATTARKATDSGAIVLPFARRAA